MNPSNLIHPSKPFVSPLYSSPRVRFTQPNIFSAGHVFKHFYALLSYTCFLVEVSSVWLRFSYAYVSLCLFRTNFTENIAIEGRNLSFSVGTRQGKTIPILTDCSLHIPSGQFWMLLGPNGCGKSTLLKVCKNPQHTFHA